MKGSATSWGGLIGHEVIYHFVGREELSGRVRGSSAALRSTYLVGEIHKIGIMFICLYRFQLGHRSLITRIAQRTKGCEGCKTQYV